jgi:adenosine deaminase
MSPQQTSTTASSSNNNEKDESYSSSDDSFSLLHEYLARIPKVELHAHLNGCIREETLFQLAAQRNVKLSDHHFHHHHHHHHHPTTASCKNTNGLLYNVRPRSLQDCFDMFAEIPLAVNDIPALQRITREALHDFAYLDACAYVELRSTPKRLLLKHYASTVDNEDNCSNRDISDNDPDEPVLMDKRTYIETILQVMQDFEQEEEERYQRDLDATAAAAAAAECTTTTSSMMIRLPMICRLIVAVDRSQSLQEATETIDLAIEFYTNNNQKKNTTSNAGENKASRPAARVVGVDLGGNPTQQDFQLFAPLFAKARSAGLKVTLHCGEVPCNDNDNVTNNDDSPKARYDVAMAILDFRPDRLGHAMLLPQNLQERIIQEKIPVETCPTSNVMTLELTKKNKTDNNNNNNNNNKAVHSNNHGCIDDDENIISSHNSDSGNLIAGLRHHPTLQRWLLHDQHPVCISTDDPGVFCTSLTQELLLVAKTFSNIIPMKQLAQLVVDGMQHAFCDEDTKSRIQQRMQQQLDQLHA